MALPILYSLQHCPYAMRARLGLLLAQQAVMVRAIVMKTKPAEMLQLSPKGTVPVLVIADSSATEAFSSTVSVIDESLDIMLWALKINDPMDLLLAKQPELLAEMLVMIEHNDKVFKPQLEQYKNAKRYHKASEIDDRQECEQFIVQLEARLNQHQFIFGESPSLVDYALLPFVRQFAKVDRQWYLQAPYPKLQAWLKNHLDSPLFSKAMTKFPLYLETHEGYLLGEKL
ncbi:glutathione S-transferase [Shewanella sp. UCD-KL12]|uniref:glutathione S-transferase n=1 Tax=Shewanella sp. UCD-KL12 TaxID=1917163 RepID=UPI000970D5C8|nr:glutathione S-transferase [Shewanella sp. UCD-KL12]